MLSRIAESLFWIGRYIERADDTARILDIYLQQILEDASVERAACQSLFEVMGRELDGAEEDDDGPAATIGVQHVLDQLVYDQSSPSSITGALFAARINARSARDSVSSELWEALNLTYLELDEQRRRAERMGPHRFFQWVRERTALAAGVADSTMSRDESWRFLVLGRSIERADMTARLITLNDIYSFDPDAKVELDDFVDIVGRNFKQPKEGLGFDGSPVAHMWRTINWPTRYL